MVKALDLVGIESPWISSGLSYNLNNKVYFEIIDTNVSLDQPSTEMRGTDCV